MVGSLQVAQESPLHRDIKRSKRAQVGSPAWASKGPGDPGVGGQGTCS